MRDKNDKIEISTSSNKEIYISKLFMDIRKANNGYVPFSELTDDDKLFEVIVENQELTRPLYMLMALLNKHNDYGELTIENVLQEFLDLLVECGMKANVGGAEFIINRLIRSKIDKFRRPDFSKEVLEPYQIIPVSNSLEKNKSPIIGLSFQNIRRQLLSEDMYEDRNGTSYLDSLFKENISTKQFKKYRKMARKEKENNKI